MEYWNTWKELIPILIFIRKKQLTHQFKLKDKKEGMGRAGVVAQSVGHMPCMQ